MGSHTHLSYQSYHTAVVLADEGSVGDQCSLAHMLLGGEGGPVDMVEARVEYKKVADQGHVFAQYRLALMLHDGAGGPVDMAEARVQFGKSAEQGHRHAE